MPAGRMATGCPVVCRWETAAAGSDKCRRPDTTGGEYAVGNPQKKTDWKIGRLQPHRTQPLWLRKRKKRSRRMYRRKNWKSCTDILNNTEKVARRSKQLRIAWQVWEDTCRSTPSAPLQELALPITRRRKDGLLSPVSVSAKPLLPLKRATVTSIFGYRIHPITGELDFHTVWIWQRPRGRVSAPRGQER